MGSVTRARSPIRLTATEFNILAVLVRQSDRVVYKEQLFGQVWKYGADRHLLEVHMISLRHKLKVHGSRMIHTVQGLRLRPATLRTTVVRVD
jgi:DNA-binding response OmpR family regulator